MATKNNTLERYTEIEINGKKHRFQYTIRSIINAEKELDTRSILTTIAAPPLSFADSFTFFKAGLLGGGAKISDDEVENLLLDYLDSSNLGDLQTLILDALVRSGTLGKLDNNAKNA